MKWNPVILLSVVALAAFGIYLAVHVIGFRRYRPQDWFGFLKKLYAILLPAVFFLAYWGYGSLERSAVLGPTSSRDLMLFALAIFVFLYFLTLSLYSAVDHSIRIRVTVELHKVDGGPLTMSQILAQYQPRAAAERRIEKMVSGGYLKRHGDKFVLTSKGRLFGCVFRWLKEFLKIGIGG